MDDQLKGLVLLLIVAFVYFGYRNWANKRYQSPPTTDNSKSTQEPLVKSTSHSNDEDVERQSAELNNVLDNEMLIAMRTGGVFLFISCAMRVLGIIALSLAVTLEGGNFTDLLTFRRISFTIMELLAGYMLWKGNLNWSGTAIFFTILIFIGAAFRPLAAMYFGVFDLGMMLSLIGYLFLVIALSVTILGKASRKRTWLGIGIFTVGFVGLSTIGSLSTQLMTARTF